MKDNANRYKYKRGLNEGDMRSEIAIAGAGPGFSNRGGAKYYVHATHVPSSKREVPIRPGYGAIKGGPGNSRILDAISCYLSLTLKHSDTKPGKNHSR